MIDYYYYYFFCVLFFVIEETCTYLGKKIVKIGALNIYSRHEQLTEQS